MNLRLQTPLLQSITALMLISSLLFVPLALQAQEAPSVDEQLEALSVSLSALGNAISESTTITDQERLALLLQLIAISSQIIELRNSQLPGAPVVVVDEETNAMTAQEAGLERIVLNMVSDSTSVRADFRYASSTPTKTYTVTDNDWLGIDEQVSDSRNQVVNKIATEKGIILDEVNDATFVTVEHPASEQWIIPNSNEAVAYAKNFGKHSIVNRVEITPHGEDSVESLLGFGQITFFTDQGERMVLSLKKNKPREQSDFGLKATPAQTYTYKMHIYFGSASSFGTYIGREEEDRKPPPPMVSQEATNVSQEEVEDFILTLFNDVPFATEIEDYEQKLLSFLLSNTAFFRTTESSVVTEEDRVCYPEYDRVVVTEFIDFVLSGMGAQYESIDEIIYFLAPVRRVEESYTRTQSDYGCQAVFEAF